MDTKGIETAAYYIALFTIIGIPPGVSLWFLIHPFIHWWRRLGLFMTWVILIPVVFWAGFVIYSARNYLLQIHFGVRTPLIIMAVFFFLAGIYLGIRRWQYLSISTMLGVPEILRNNKPGDLVTKGIYGKVRHPRYLEIGFVLSGIAFFVNYLAVYVLLIAYIPVIYLVVLFEERELKERFGAAYEQYRREVPRFIPRRRGST
jgi:protein-S-isoprenylcysteine O-methyltransferase Ste14